MRSSVTSMLVSITFLGAAFAFTREPVAVTPTGFTFVKEVVVPGTPEQVYDAFTGDVTPWWDHSFSAKPVKMVIEPRPGGSFYETFDAAGNGCEHAHVTYADRGKKLAFTGPLGLAMFGVSVQMAHTFTFTAVGEDQTRLVLTVSAVGALPDGIGATVEGVWHHFLVERFVPHVTSRMEGR